MDSYLEEVIGKLKVGNLVEITFKTRFDGKPCIGRVYDSNMEDDVNSCGVITPDGGTIQIYLSTTKDILTIKPIKYSYLD